MKLPWRTLSAVAMLYGLATVAKSMEPAPIPMPDFSTQTADSITIGAFLRISGSATAVIWRVHEGRAPSRVEVGHGRIQMDTVVLEDGRVHWRARVAIPAPGDTIHYSYSFRTQSATGAVSREVFSGYLRLIGEWGPPVPLVIGIDPFTGPPDSIQIAYTDATVPDTIRLGVPGDSLRPNTVQLCVIVWRGGKRYMAREQAPACYGIASRPGYRT